MYYKPMHPITAGLTAILIGVLLLVNFHPTFPWWRLERHMPDDRYDHGWPLVFMVRELYDARGDMGGIIHHPWPFFGDPPLRSFELAPLIFDIIVALLLLTLTAVSVDSYLRTHDVTPQFSMRFLFVISAAASVALASLRMVTVYVPWQVVLSVGVFGFLANFLLTVSIIISARLLAVRLAGSFRRTSTRN